MTHPYRAEHVGSLLRPAELLRARADPATSRDDLRALEDREILRVLRRQQELGLTLFTDGELRRRTFMSDFNESVDGLDDDEAIARSWQGAAEARPSAVSGIATRKLRQTKRLTDHEVGFLQQHSPGAIKVTLPSANQFPAIAWKRGLSDAAYPTHADLLWDCVPIIRDEIRALADAGVQYIQIDAPRYSYYIDPKWREYIRAEMGKDPDAALDEAIEADNSCLAGVARDGLTLAIHLCRGNNRSQWYAEGGYDPIAEKLFGRLQVDAFLLEYESERAGSFAPLRFVPSGKTVVLGLVSTKLPQLESGDQLIRRIEEASKYVPLERLALSPQCGFASTMEGNLLSEDDQWRKLALVVETARRVWPA
jgi:5-methyltetrahydropteroyltriglutamate--homocysteine methyltransferase